MTSSSLLTSVVQCVLCKDSKRVCWMLNVAVADCLLGLCFSPCGREKQVKLIWTEIGMTPNFAWSCRGWVFLGPSQAADLCNTVFLETRCKRRELCAEWLFAEGGGCCCAQLKSYSRASVPFDSDCYVSLFLRVFLIFGSCSGPAPSAVANSDLLGCL